jgi:23S rRNA pseudouridine2605 synthase|tara:strand:+ start:21373 stop:22296 length:924 start_codon:yes stop_codon:yes gene_type:complete
MNKKRGGGAKPTRKTGPAGKTKSTTRPKTAGAQSRSAAGVEPEKKTVSARDKRKYIDFKQKQKKGDPMPKFDEDGIRLNKYLSNAGICSRREADVFIANGIVSVNGEIITEMGYKVKNTDVVKYGDDSVRSATKRYVLLNKPKGFITAMDDALGRKTVMSLVKKATKEQLYPVGRMEKEATGLMFFTNDGDMMKKLTHPRYKAKKIYHLELDKPVKKEDLERLTTGIDLEDGKTFFDHAEYVKDNSREIGVELTSGKNSVARRAMESMGYVVLKVDRVQYAGLTKKDLPRGHYRVLSEKEVSFLKMS